MRTKHKVALVSLAVLVSALALIWNRRSVDPSPLSIVLAGKTNVGGEVRLILLLSNSGPRSVRWRGDITFRERDGAMITFSSNPEQIRPHQSITRTDIPAHFLRLPSSIMVSWELSWRYHLHSIMTRFPILPQSQRDKILKYHFARSPEYVP